MDNFSTQDLAAFVGQGVDYTGDMCNAAGQGAIIEVHPGTQYAGLSFTITLEDGRHMQRVSICCFGRAVGSRYQFNQVQHGAPYLAQLAAARILRAAQGTAREQLKKEAYARDVLAIKAAHPELKVAEDRYAGGKLAAANMRIMLKAAFKGCKFSVRSDYNSVNISWTGGPTVGEVDAVVGRFDAGHMDVTGDYTDFTSTAWTDTFGGVKYLFTHRSSV